MTFQLKADLVGAVKFTDLSNADFVFDALLEQDILEYIRTELNGQFTHARKVADEGIEAAQSKLTQAEKTYNDAIDKAQSGLDAAYNQWKAKSDNVHKDADRVIQGYNAEIKRLQDDIDRTKRDFDNAMTAAEKAVDHADRERAQKLADARHGVDDAEREMVAKIKSAQAGVDRAQADMDRAFGSAHDAIEAARRKVQGFQSQIDALNATLTDYRNAPAYQFWKKLAIGGLETAVLTVEGFRAGADFVLQRAEDVLTSASYLAKETTLKRAHDALDYAQTAGTTAFDGAKALLRDADTASSAVLQGAKDTLEATRTGVEHTAFQGAVSALQAYKEANTAAFNAAAAAIQGLEQGTEWVLYQAAKGTLATAKHATVGIDAAKKSLDIVKDSVQEALKLTQWIEQFGLEIVDIRSVHLSGSLRGIVGVDGKESKPLTTHVKGTIVSRDFTIDTEFDPRRTADFIAKVFEKYVLCYFWMSIILT